MVCRLHKCERISKWLNPATNLDICHNCNILDIQFKRSAFINDKLKTFSSKNLYKIELAPLSNRFNCSWVRKVRRQSDLLISTKLINCNVPCPCGELLRGGNVGDMFVPTNDLRACVRLPRRLMFKSFCKNENRIIMLQVKLQKQENTPLIFLIKTYRDNLQNLSAKGNQFAFRKHINVTILWFKTIVREKYEI